MIGIDEVGRGSLVGEVFACACFFDCELGFEVKDSKKLNHLKREEIYHKLKNHPKVKFAIGIASLKEIEEINILNATMLAMERAFFNLGINGVRVMVDGNKKPFNIPFSECVIKGDALIKQISAASIIAKYLRDKNMDEIHNVIPQYGIDRNKGYGTAMHLEAIKHYGFSCFHRKKWKFTNLINS